MSGLAKVNVETSSRSASTDSACVGYLATSFRIVGVYTEIRSLNLQKRKQ
jgi:hypothetical protein